MPLPDRNELVDGASGRRTTWADLEVPELPSPCAVVVRRGFDALPAVAAHVRDGVELLVVAEGRLEPELRRELSEAGFHLVDPDGAVTPPETPRDPEPGRLWLLTSGSTGRPKRVGHTLASLTTVTGQLPPRRWLCPYSPGTYAWWQVVTLGLGVEGQDLIVVDATSGEEWLEAAVEHGVTAVSGTPTFWRQALMAHGSDLARMPLEQATLGGEPVDQAVLDQLREVFPQARVSWIYASSEAGAAIVVHDGRAGFPEEWLGREVAGRPVLDVVDGELVITSPHHGEGLDGPLRTGDAVVVADGRVLVTGRVDSDEINVGGSKVSAAAVREVLLAHPDVAWAHVRGRRAPLVGTMVVARVVLRSGSTDPAAVADLTTWCRERLPEHGVPRRLTLLESIPVKETLKSDV